jgi:ABC-type sugar transport system permease subunit
VAAIVTGLQVTLRGARFAAFVSEARRGRLGYLFILPASLVLAVVVIYPLVSLVWISLHRVEPLRGEAQPFIGLDNYGRLLRDGELLGSLGQTLVWTAGSVVLQFTLGLVAAVILNESFRGRGIARALLLLPWAMPAIAGAFAWKWLYHAQYGLLNEVLTGIGIVGRGVNWLGDPGTAMAAAIVTNTWRGFPFMMLMLLAAMQAIPRELYEASAVDGASFGRQLRHVTLPLVRPVVFVVTLLAGIWTFNNFTYIYVLTGGGPAGRTEILITYVYRNGFEYFRFGYAAALSIVLFGLVVVFSGLYVRLMARRGAFGD